ncbi:hypothetical protein EU524_01095 [Candidatus Thorarchaeota archaeon]|nr:MAG: hypothetical protein EU524_01095 [Candidatus Thorarchaeota archaeon]
MNQFLIALCGLPASGKSRLADSISQEAGKAVEIVRTDEWRTDEYYRDWAPEKESPVREMALERTENLIADGKSVIHDDTNYYKSMRHELYEIALKNRCIFAVVHVTTPLAVALEWNRGREASPIDESVIRGIAERMDVPGGRYLWDQPVAEVDMSTDDSEATSVLIVNILEELHPVARPDPVPSSSRTGDEIDVHTREIVAEFLREHPKLRKNKDVSLIRRDVLSKAMGDNLSVRVAGNMLRNRLQQLLKRISGD